MNKMVLEVAQQYFCEKNEQDRNDHGDCRKVIEESIKRVCTSSEIHDDAKICQMVALTNSFVHRTNFFGQKAFPLGPGICAEIPK